MVLGKIKVGKIATVIFLTVLIWVWQDLALDEEFTVPNATIIVANSPSNLWVSFKNRRSVSIENIKLKGPASKISEVRRKWNAGSLRMDFTLNPEREGMTTAGPRTLNVLDFVKKSDKMKELPGLTIQSCEPEIIDVNVVELVEKQLDVECVNEDGALVEVESIEPAKVSMFVPTDSRLKARVRLTRREIENARETPIVKRPFVTFATDQIRQVPTDVEIKIPTKADSLTEYSIGVATLGITLSANLVGKYHVDVTNIPNVVHPFTILASSEAKLAYENEPYQMNLYILDSDADQPPNREQRRRVVYNFPEEYLRRNEIRLKDQPAEARFRLIKLPLPETP
jgi:hypothetical protein